jgi:hypothetical protein
VSSKKDPILILTILVALGAGAFGWAQYRRANQLAAEQLAQSQLADQRYDDLLKKLQAAERRANDLDTALAAIPSPAAAQPGEESGVPRPPAATIADDRQPRPFGGQGDTMAALMENPEVLALMTTQQKAMLDGRYSDLFKSLNLSPADLEKFKSLLVDKQNVMRDVRSAAREQGLNGRENRDQLRSLVEQANTELDANILAALGQEKYNQYKYYEQTQPQRNLVNQLDRRLNYTTASLSDAQSSQLVQILAQSSQNNSSNNSGGGRVGPGGVSITDSVVSQAQGVLTPAQLDALKQLQAEQQAQRQLREQMRNLRQQQNNNANASGAATGAPAAAPQSTSVPKN